MADEQDRHLSDDQLLALVDGTSSIDAYAEHLDGCARCRSTLTLAHAAAPSRQPATLRIGRYEIRGLLGEGGMGVVYRAWDPEIHREVALKLWTQVSGSTREKLLHEARVMGRLSHPGLCSVHDAGHDPSAGTFIATSLIGGETLRRWMRGPVTPDERVRVLCEMAEAIAVAHDAGVAHGDIKPENVVMRRDGRPVVTDFGLAAVEGKGPRGGTLGYAAPEQHSEGATAKADQFAFCTMAQELAPNRRLARVWARGRQERPEARWPDMHALIAALDRARRGPVWWTIGAVGVLSVGMLLLQPRDPEACALDAGSQRADWAAQREVLETTTWNDRRLDAVEERVARWSEAAEQSCDSEEAQACVLQAGAELMALRARLDDPGLQLAGWLAGLPDPWACFDAKAPIQPSPLLLEARSMRRAGNVRGAARAAGRIALTTDDPALAAEAELLRGKSLAGVDAVQARDSLWRATVAASSEHRPDLEAEGLLGLVMLEVQDARLNEATRLLQRARPLVNQHRPDLRPAVAFMEGLTADARGDTVASLRAMHKAVELAAEYLEEGDPFGLQYRFEYGLALARAGRFRESIESLEAVRSLSVRHLGPQHPRSRMVDVELAAQLANLGEWEQARVRLESALPGLEAGLGARSPLVLDARRSLALVLLELEAYEPSRDLFEALHTANDREGRPHAALDCACSAGDVEVAMSQWASARDRYERAIAYAAEHELLGPPVGACLARLGLALCRLGDSACRTTLEQAVAVLDVPSAAPLDASLAKFELARQLRDPDRAQELAEDALALLSSEGAVADRRRKAITAWLAEGR